MIPPVFSLLFFSLFLSFPDLFICDTDYKLNHISYCDDSSQPNPNQKWVWNEGHTHLQALEGSEQGCLSCFDSGCEENDLLSVATCDLLNENQFFKMIPFEEGEPYETIVHAADPFTCMCVDELTPGSLVRQFSCDQQKHNDTDAIILLWSYNQTSQQLFTKEGFCLDRTPQFYDPWPCSGTGLPNSYACGCLENGGVSASLPFCNTNLTVSERVQDLIGRLSLPEKQGLLGGDLVHTDVDDCSNMDGGVTRLGIPPNLNLVETNSAVASICLGEVKCATEFPAPACLAASFNRTAWYYKGTIISSEIRAMSNLHNVRGTSSKAFIGQMGFGPNINIVRDPRFGRNSELPSEDPTLAGLYATSYVNGMQKGPDERYLKMVSGLKHYTAYSVENGRAYRIYNISMFDLFDTYLAQYKLAFSPEYGNAMAMMCSYSGVNGVPMCANDYLINQVVRTAWNRSDVLTVTDCGAINNMIVESMYASSAEEAAALALEGGSDLDLGDTIYPPNYNGGGNALSTAISWGYTSEDQVDEALTRVLNLRFRVGQFDPNIAQPYTQYGAESVNTTASWDFVLDSVLQGLVLLKNEQNTLPFSPSTNGKLAILGPHCCTHRDLFEDYAGDQLCADGTYDCIETVGEAFQRLYPGQVTVREGVDLQSNRSDGIPEALAAGKEADHIILMIGIGHDQEHEGIDRTEISLPGLQEPFAQMVLELNKPTVVVLISGGVVAIDNLIPFSNAIIQAFYPAYRTGEALFHAVFGYQNRWGKLPVTMYPKNYVNEVDMYDFDMNGGVGRTYRYYVDKPLFPFGFGLSYTEFQFSCESEPPSGENFVLNVVCMIQNVGSRAGDEVLILYHSVGEEIRHSVNHPVPSMQLVDFQRLRLFPTGAFTQVLFQVSYEGLALTNSIGDKVVYSGNHFFSVQNGLSASDVGYIQKTTFILDPAPQPQ